MFASNTFELPIILLALALYSMCVAQGRNTTSVWVCEHQCVRVWIVSLWYLAKLNSTQKPFRQDFPSSFPLLLHLSLSPSIHPFCFLWSRLSSLLDLLTPVLMVLYLLFAFSLIVHISSFRFCWLSIASSQRQSTESTFVYCFFH